MSRRTMLPFAPMGSKSASKAERLTPRQMAQRLRRLKEAEQRARYEAPPPGPNYGSIVLAEDDERVERIVRAMGTPAFLPIVAAAALNGVAEGTLQRWFKSGKTDMEEGIESVNARFARAVDAASAAASGDLRQRQLSAKMAHEAKTYATLLETARPDWFVLKSASDKSQGTTPDQLAELFDAIVKEESARAMDTSPPILSNGAASRPVACIVCDGACSCPSLQQEVVPQ